MRTWWGRIESPTGIILPTTTTTTIPQFKEDWKKKKSNKLNYDCD